MDDLHFYFENELTLEYVELDGIFIIVIIIIKSSNINIIIINIKCYHYHHYHHHHCNIFISDNPSATGCFTWGPKCGKLF